MVMGVPAPKLGIGRLRGSAPPADFRQDLGFTCGRGGEDAGRQRLRGFVQFASGPPELATASHSRHVAFEELCDELRSFATPSATGGHFDVRIGGATVPDSSDVVLEVAVHVDDVHRHRARHFERVAGRQPQAGLRCDVCTVHPIVLARQCQDLCSVRCVFKCTWHMLDH